MNQEPHSLKPLLRDRIAQLRKDLDGLSTAINQEVTELENSKQADDFPDYDGPRYLR